jgi:hypothetical protein
LVARRDATDPVGEGKAIVAAAIVSVSDAGLMDRTHANANVCLDAAASAEIVMKVSSIKTTIVKAVVAFGVSTAFWKM